jgi:amino acid transporter
VSTETPTTGSSNADDSSNHLTLTRGFDFRAIFALTFSDISPIVSIYTVFGIIVYICGAGFWWAMPIVLGGQLLVAATLGDVASKFPLAGSVYQWSRYLVNARYGWFTAWAYIWGLTIALATLALGSANFLLGVLNITTFTHNQAALVALGLTVFASAINIAGRQILKWFFYVSIVAEVLCSVVLGTVLLIAYRVNPISVIFHSAGASHGSAYFFGPFIAAVSVAGWSFLGFEAAGSVAEEVDNPGRQVPRAIFFSLLGVGAIVLYISLALCLSIPNIGAVMSGSVASPIAAVLTTHFGASTARAFQLLFLIGFMASFMAVQAAVTRCIWANARDRVLPASNWLLKLTKHEKLPYNAVIFTGVIAGALPFINDPKIYGTLINFTSAGFFIAYALPVFGALWLRTKGKWEAGPWTLGTWGPLITWAATVWLVFEIINILWPRAELYGAGFLAWSAIYMVIGLAVIGFVIQAWVFRDGGRHVRQGNLEGIEGVDLSGH